MAKLSYKYPFAEEICGKLGINPNDVRKVTTVSEVGRPEFLIIELYANSDVADPRELLKHYTLQPVFPDSLQ